MIISTSDCPSDWSIKQVQDVMEVNAQTLNGSTSKDYLMNYISIESVKEQSIDWGKVQQTTFAESPSRARRLIKNGDLLISTVRPNLKSFAIFKAPQEGNWVASTGFAVASADTDFSAQFYFYQILSGIGAKQFHSLVVGSNYPAINEGEFRRIRLFDAPLPEQKAIAGILSKVDEAIESVENSIKAAERLKKSLMQNLLTGKLKPDGNWRSKDEFYVDEKFGKVPKGWETRKGKDLFRAYGSTSLDKVDLSKSGDCVYMKVSDFNLEGNELYINAANITFDYDDNQNLTYCMPGFLVVSKRGEAIRKNRVRLLKKRTLLDPNLMAFEIIDGDSLFYKFLIEEMNLQRFLENSALPQLNNKDFYPRHFLYPPIGVQLMIGDLLLKSHLEIGKKYSKIQSLQKLKKSLMQNLLTGKVRVDVEKINKLLEEV